MKIKKVSIDSEIVTFVDENFIQDYQKKGFFDVDNALELIKNKEKVYSNFSYFELVRE